MLPLLAVPGRRVRSGSGHGGGHGGGGPGWRSGGGWPHLKLERRTGYRPGGKESCSVRRGRTQKQSWWFDELKNSSEFFVCCTLRRPRASLASPSVAEHSRGHSCFAVYRIRRPRYHASQSTPSSISTSSVPRSSRTCAHRSCPGWSLLWRSRIWPRICGLMTPADCVLQSYFGTAGQRHHSSLEEDCSKVTHYNRRRRTSQASPSPACDSHSPTPGQTTRPIRTSQQSQGRRIFRQPFAALVRAYGRRC